MKRWLAGALCAMCSIAQAQYEFCNLDVDGDGIANAATDGVVVARYMLGVRGAALTANAVNPMGQRTAPAQVESYLQSNCVVPTTGIANFGAKGVWIGTSTGGRNFFTFITSDGQFWGAYTPLGGAPYAAGAFYGQASESGTNLSVAQARDYNYETRALFTTSLVGSYTPGATLTVTATSGSTGSVNAAFVTGLPIPPSIAATVGTYSGQYGSNTTGIGTVALTLNPDGSFNLIGGTCQASGTLRPRLADPMFDVVVTFAAGQCAYPLASMRGIAFYYAPSKELYGFVLNAEKNIGFHFYGIRL